MRSADVTTADATIDITREVCPMTFVRTKIALERLPVGAILEVRLRGEEPLRNVPDSARDAGHTVLGLEALDDGTWRLLLRREAPRC
jgi:tRNA 2-thiouridine synthesizing protein A